MFTEFKAITIDGKPDTNHVHSGSINWLFIFPFPISSIPPKDWIEIFKNECSSRRKAKLSNSQITKDITNALQEIEEGNWLSYYKPEIPLDKDPAHILLECTPEALPQLSEYLLVDVATTNRKHGANQRAIREAIGKIELP